MNLLKELENLPQICVYGLFNEADKKVYIGYAYDTLLALYRNIRNLKYSNGDWNKLEFRIIETLPSRKDIRLRYQYWIYEYSNMGYQMYRKHVAVKFKLHIDIIRDFKVEGSQRLLFRVMLVSKKGLRRLVGIFEHKHDMDKFVNKYYSNKDNIVHVYKSDNEMTKLYEEKYG